MSDIPKSHPRYVSLITRENLVAAAHAGIVSYEGLTSHGRGEAFDYLLGEKTSPSALEAEKSAAKVLLAAKHPVLSINGNTAALAAAEIADLQKASGAEVEVNLFHRTEERVKKVEAVLEAAGCILNKGKPERCVPLPHDRGLCDPDGIGSADVVLVGAVVMGSAQADALWLTGAVIFASVAAFGIGSIILGIIDRVIKHAPPKFSTCLGLLIIIAGMGVFLTSGESMNLWLLIIVEALFGVGIAIFVTPNSTAIMNSVSEREYSLASGTLSTVRMLGMALSFGIVAILETLFITGAAELYASEFLIMLHGTILASIGVLVVALLLSWFGGAAKKV